MCGELKPRSGPESAEPPGAATERLSTGAAMCGICHFCYLAQDDGGVRALRGQRLEQRREGGARRDGHGLGHLHGVGERLERAGRRRPQEGAPHALFKPSAASGW